MDAVGFRELVVKYARVAFTFTKDHLRSGFLLAHVDTEGMKRRWQNLIDRHPNAHALSIHMHDGWSAFCASTTVARAKDTHLIRRNGKLKHELLLQRRVLKIISMVRVLWVLC